METTKLVASVVSVLLAIAAFVIAKRADVRAKKAEAIKSGCWRKWAFAWFDGADIS
ncbi:MAG TPA: hypothetical protein VNP04_20980 [Alphaproteobacteria bacterium]|nr:hypothetical protein [Alphaproteobacteria bacterium]